MNKLLITRRNDKILSALWDGSQVVEFQAENADRGPSAGDIYIGRLKDLVKNINAGFVEISPGEICFYQFPPDGSRYKIGDEFVVQITREAVKTKSPVVSDQLSLNGRLLVLNEDNCRVSVSAKISNPDRRQELKALLEETAARNAVGFILRTNAEYAENEEILKEAEVLLARRKAIREKARFRPCFSKLEESSPSYLAMIQNAGKGTLEEVVTDEEDIYQQVCDYYSRSCKDSETNIYLYRDSMLPMASLYRLEYYLKMALERRVWLKSGGYLVIEPTEALTVIDVNTGKYDGHKNREETFFKINMEAAQEIAFQLRLRNLSGIILVDFIDLKSEEKQQELYDYLKELLRKDSVKSVLVDITPLHLAEITRKKIRATLSEQLKTSEKRNGRGN
ncbi:MAG: ribonuclease E/G [Clostridiales bacterium]|nr:ribonuclease E/G [Clostridiales bacterium]